MTRPAVASRAEWLAARAALLAEEKAVTGALDALAARRRALPMVPVPEEYVFEGAGGRVRLPELFEGRRQLIVYHLMWQWDRDEGCPGCAAVLDGIARSPGRDTAFAAISRGPWERLAGYHAAHGWAFPMYSSFGSAFNYDFHVSLDADIAPVRYNYRSAREHALAGRRLGDEQPGVSVFWRDDDDAVFHTYSAYARGIEPLIGAYAMLDLTPLGRPR
ncbi:DUF899 family protein [Nocardia harenae]|uniref:DUF899 family protein n=1 Tax=Nocardia harenae TaxID=358707 RepID=UPI0008339D33|nr:DUF899 family protein [Nocardia harenae]